MSRPPIFAVNHGRLKYKIKTVLQNLPNIAFTGQVWAFAHIFREAASNGGSGIWWLCLPGSPMPVTPAVGRFHRAKSKHVLSVQLSQIRQENFDGQKD
jgi:hypothetical protein